MDIIARISSRIYLGEQLCRNEDWLKITKNYTACFYTASTKLRMFPRHLRIFAHWFLPECRRLRQERNHAREIITPLIKRRRELRQSEVAAGKPPTCYNDAIDWAEQEAAIAGTAFDPVIFQLTLSLLAIHTTFDLLQQTMIELGQKPEFQEPLRDEIQQVLATDGWKKTSIFKMKLLDSAIKEAQRLKPGSIGSLTLLVEFADRVQKLMMRCTLITVTMRRYVLEDLQLSNGLVLKKGTRLNVDNQRLTDPEIYDQPNVYDPFRFYNMRSQFGKDHIAQLVSTSPDHLGFGHGEHSCPGRFFAANEIKVALCHILVKYDWKLAPLTETTPDTKGVVSKSSPRTEILIRRRVSEQVDIDSL
ncbi:hypothetical protein E4U55_006095 [Claviceps digitariae]|nr:hypothetical protein E4U55_006095 [Claviceps digitariae]